MIDASTLLAFAPAVALITVSPGPDTIYALTQSLRNGRSAGLVAGLGTATGVLIHTGAAVLGVAALLRASTEAYLLLKYAGAAYLVYLGVRTVRTDAEFEARDDPTDSSRSLARSYRSAVLINVSNPKVAVFVVTFFPQFVPPSANATIQMSILGAVYAGLSLSYLAGVAVVAGRVRPYLFDTPRAGRLVQYPSGSVLIGFGVHLLLNNRPPA